MPFLCKALIFVSVIVLVINPLHAYQNTPEDNKNLIMTAVVVNTRSGLAKGLKRESFTVIDEKAVRPIEFFDDADTPVSIGILVDNSGSMQASMLGGPSKRKVLGEELKSFLAVGHPDNEYFLMSFNKTPKLLADWSTANDMLAQTLDIEEPRRQTALYDTIFAALEKLYNRPRSRTALLLISDGQDNASRHTFKELRTVLRDTDVIVYAIGLMSGSDVGSSLGIEGQGILDELSETTGGRGFYPESKKEMRTMFSLIASELHHQYRLGFRADKSDVPNKWRRIKVKVTPSRTAPSEFKDLSVRARYGYYTH